MSFKDLTARAEAIPKPAETAKSLAKVAAPKADSKDAKPKPKTT